MFYPRPSLIFDVPFFLRNLFPYLSSPYPALRQSTSHPRPRILPIQAASTSQARARSFAVGRVCLIPCTDRLAIAFNESNENLELDESIKHGEQITDVDTDTFSITCSSSSITPLKRSITDNDRGEDLSVDTIPTQHSSSKMKKNKIEKEDV
ncbi:hypothetical protein Taro_043438 [Colocasia esculenta]|uniref:Uncharacterized protein n=1 Tax=Colocasia esculenta TaxID=4460 RepID=A0A843X444_COLES|nr:hypothetical protein [Colocasia esculenta]